MKDLERRYAASTSQYTVHTQWTSQLTSTVEDLQYFRGDNAYLWQYASRGEARWLRFFVLANYVKGRDQAGLLGTRLDEDGSYGCLTYEYPSLPLLSRDLLDSVNEISFLDRQLGILARTGLEVLDIGAGYGRLAHRALSAAEGIRRYWCVDAVPRSTFLCEHYLGAQPAAISRRASVLALDEIDGCLVAGSIDLAVNVHSFSEMSFAAVSAWLDLLARLEVQWLFVVPNEHTVLSTESDGSRRDCSEALRASGYELTVDEPAILDEGVRAVVGVHDRFLLYRRQGTDA